MRKFPFYFEIDYGARKERIKIKNTKEKLRTEVHLKILLSQEKILGWKTILV